MNTVLRGTISLHRLLPPCVVAALVIGLAGCSHGDPAPNLSNASTDVLSSATSGGSTAQPSSTTTPSGGSASSSVKPTSTASSAAPVVPVDQIPPGNPERWVPAGVPTTAPYKEPGDIVPMFTRDMFVNSQAGALATARYYLDARNWAYATMNAQPFLLICDAAKCKTDASSFAADASLGRHIAGARQTHGRASVATAPAVSRAQWLVQLRMLLASGKLVERDGTVVKTQHPEAQVVNLFLRWNGRMWRISDEFLAA
jgi:hypothetical protein